MAWHRPNDKPLSEPMMIRSLTYICVIRPQWGLVMQKWVNESQFDSQMSIWIICISSKLKFVWCTNHYMSISSLFTIDFVCLLVTQKEYHSSGCYWAQSVHLTQYCLIISVICLNMFPVGVLLLLVITLRWNDVFDIRITSLKPWSTNKSHKWNP